MINNDEIKKLAGLAKLRFSEKELDGFTADMKEIIGFADEINDIEYIESANLLSFCNTLDGLREDEIKPSYPIEEIVPEYENGMFIVKGGII